MDLFPFPFLSALAEKNPALARACEIALYSAAVYLLTALQSGEIVDIRGVLMALATPLLAYFGKLVRDLGTDA